MIIQYKKFINILNEKQDWINIKNSLNKLLYDVDDNIKNNVNIFIDKLIKDNGKNTKKISIEYFKSQEQDIKKILEETNNLEELKTQIINILKMVYSSLISILNMIDNDLNIEDIFTNSDNNIKKLFVINEKIFDKNIQSFSINLISEFSDRYNFKKEDVYKQLSDEKILPNDEQKKEISDAIGEEIDDKNDTNLEGLKTEIINWFLQVIYKNIYNFINNN